MKLPSKIGFGYLVFYVSMLKKCIGHPESIRTIGGLGVKDILSYGEIPIKSLIRK